MVTRLDKPVTSLIFFLKQYLFWRKDPVCWFEILVQQFSSFLRLVAALSFAGKYGPKIGYFYENTRIQTLIILFILIQIGKVSSIWVYAPRNIFSKFLVKSSECSFAVGDLWQLLQQYLRHHSNWPRYVPNVLDR